MVSQNHLNETSTRDILENKGFKLKTDSFGAARRILTGIRRCIESELLIEFVVGIVIECIIETGENSKIPKYVRYSLLVITVLFFLAGIGVIFFAGSLAIQENIAAGIALLSLGSFMLAACIANFKKGYLAQANKRD